MLFENKYYSLPPPSNKIPFNKNLQIFFLSILFGVTQGIYNIYYMYNFYLVRG